jgi:LacI family transcriptional regulator
MKHAKITMQLIADRLGLSKYSVSQALAGKAGVSELTRREVEAMARTLGYRFKPKAGRQPVNAAQDEAKTVQAEAEMGVNAKAVGVSAAVAVPAANNPLPAGNAPHIAIWIHDAHRRETGFWTRVLDGAVQGCTDNGWPTHVLSLNELAGSSESEASAPASPPVSTRLGSIVLGTLPAALLNRLVRRQSARAPVVLVDHEEPLLRTDCILNANPEAAQSACRRILSQGCRRVLFIGKDSYSVSFKERWWGCRQAMDEHTRRHESCTLKKWTIPYGQSGWELQLGKRLGLLQPEELPDGIVCANDEIALELLKQLRIHSVSVPDMCKVIGIDNIDASAASAPPLTTVELAKEGLGYRAAEALARSIARPSAHSEKIILAAKLIVRGSG